MVDSRFFTVREPYLNDIEAPRQIAGSEALEPCVRAALDERLFGLVHRIEWADFCVFASGFHLDEEQDFSIAGDDVHFSTAPAFEVSREYVAA